jgi:hypothetical protein
MTNASCPGSGTQPWQLRHGPRCLPCLSPLSQSSRRNSVQRAEAMESDGKAKTVPDHRHVLAYRVNATQPHRLSGLCVLLVCSSTATRLETEMIVQGITVEQFNDAVAKAGAAYADNLAAEIGSEFSRTRFSARVTIKETGAQQGLPTEELASGQRRSWSGRRIKAACWHAYRDVLVEVFNISPDANVYTTMAKYKGRTGFENEYPATADRNIGSMMQPAYMPELCDCCY